MTITTLSMNLLIHKSGIKLFIFRFRAEYGCHSLYCNEQNDCIGTGNNKYCFPVDKSDGFINPASGSEILK